MARRKRKRSLSFVMMVVIAMLIAGFLARRLMMPGATHYLTYRAPEYPAQAPQTGRSQPDYSNASKPSNDHPSEHLTDSDRRALDEVIRRKSGGN